MTVRLQADPAECQAARDLHAWIHCALQPMDNARR